MTLGVVLFHSGIQLSGYKECPIIARIDQTYVLICLTISLSLVWYTLCLVEKLSLICFLFHIPFTMETPIFLKD